MKFIFLNLALSAFVFFLSEPSFAVSPTTAALGISSGQISIWDWSTNNFSYVFNYRSRYNVFFLKDGRLASQVAGPAVNIWDLTSGTVDLRLNCTGYVFEELNNGLFITGHPNVLVWNISSSPTLVKTLSPGLVIWYLKVLSVSNLLAVSVDYAGSLFIYDPDNGFALYRRFVEHSNIIWIIEELPNGNIITCSEDQTVKLWNITQLASLTSFTPFNDKIYALRMISRDTLVLGGISSSIYIYKISSSNQFVLNSSLPIPGTATKVNYIIVSKTNLVMISFDDRSLLLYNRTNMQLINSYPVNVKASGDAVYFAITENYNYEEDSSTTVEDKSISKQFKVVVDYTMEASTAIGSSFQTTNRLKCLIACANNPSCKAVTFDNNKNCILFSDYPPSNGRPLISSIGTNLHYKF